MTPWTDKLTGFTQTTGLRRYNTFHFTWPLHVAGSRFCPSSPCDHVFASPRLRQDRDVSRPATRIGSSPGHRFGRLRGSAFPRRNRPDEERLHSILAEILERAAVAAKRFTGDLKLSL